MSAILIGRRRVDSGSYLAGIDGLRGIAVLSVMTFHLIPTLLPGGFVGVDVFFVISGFVVTNSMVRQNDVPIRAFLSGFYARRFRRILPPLVACICVMGPISFAVMPNSWLSTSIQKTALCAFFGVSNFALLTTDDGYFSPRPALNPFTHTWSLAVEEQFYFIFPIMIYLILSSSRNRYYAAACWGFAAVIILSLAYSSWAGIIYPAGAYYLLPSRFWELAIGAIGALIGKEKRHNVVKMFGVKALVYTGLMLIALAAWFANENHFPIPWAIPACLGSLFVVIASSDTTSDSPIRSIVTQPVLVAIGLLSYSLYLWHWPIYTVMRWTTGLDSPILYTVAIACTTTAAILSYRLVEYPTQNWRYFRGMNNPTAIAAWLLVTVTGFVILKAVYDRPWRFQATVVEQNSFDWYPFTPPVRSAVNARCDTQQITQNENWDTIVPVNCTRIIHQGPTLFVAGDSHAGAYTRMFRNLVSTTGYKVVRFSAVGCPIANFYSSPYRFQPHCAPFEQSFVRKLASLSKPGDLLFLASLRSIRLSNQDGPVSNDDIVRDTISNRAIKDRLDARIEAEALLKTLVSRGVKVIIDLPAPVFKSPAFRCADYFNSTNPVCKQGLSVDRSYLTQLQAPVVSSMTTAANNVKHVYLWNPFPVLCPTKTCTAMQGKRPLFFDGDHLSGYGNDLLTPSFEQMIERVRSAP